MPTRRSRSRSHAGDDRARAHAANHSRCEDRTARGGLDADRKHGGVGGGHRHDAVGQIAPFARRRVVAGDAEHAHAIAAVRRRIHLEHRVVEIERLAQIGSKRQRFGQLHDALMLIAQAEFARGAEHAVRLQAAQLGALDADAARQLRADHRDGHLEAGAHVLGAADDLQPIAAVGGHLAHGQFLRIRMAAAVEHLPDQTPENGAATGVSDSTSRPARVSCSASCAGVTVSGVNSCSQREGDFHGNCFKNCRSFSKNSRRSSTP